MIRRVLLAVLLVIVWLMLWEDLSAANVLSGTVVAVAVLWLSPPPRPGPAGSFRPLAALHLVLFFNWELLKASAIVAWEVVTPDNRINEAVVAVPVRGVSDVLTTIVGNMISLTPGTLTLEVRTDPTVLYVHVMHLRTVEEVRADVLHLEALAIRAFGSDEAIALLDDERPATDAAPDDDRSGA